MDTKTLEAYWNDLPIGAKNALRYPALCNLWTRSEREVRKILHELSHYDNGDDYILVRSARGKGFYKTDDAETIEQYKRECLQKGKSIFAPVKKINRVQSVNGSQYSIENNLRVFRENAGLTQAEVCEAMKDIDKPMLSKMENGCCFPTPAQLERLAEIYGCETFDLIGSYF